MFVTCQKFDKDFVMCYITLKRPTYCAGMRLNHASISDIWGVPMNEVKNSGASNILVKFWLFRTNEAQFTFGCTFLSNVCQFWCLYKIRHWHVVDFLLCRSLYWHMNNWYFQLRFKALTIELFFFVWLFEYVSHQTSCIISLQNKTKHSTQTVPWE